MGNLVILSFALRRSGMHGILNWACRQRLPAIYFSNCKIKDNTELCVDGCTVHDYDEEVYTLSSKKYKAINLSKYKLIIFGFEDSTRNQYMNGLDNAVSFGIDFANGLSKIINMKDGKLENKSGRFKVYDLKVVYILRDIYNLMASRYKVEERLDIIDSIWKKQILDSLNLDKTHVDINFNKWFVDKRYRRKVSKNLRLKFDDEFKKMLGVAIRSSFDGEKYKHNAHKMKVLERYKNFEDDEEFLSLFNKEIKELNKEYFGMDDVLSK